MIFNIEYNTLNKRLYLIEDVGDEPCNYKCVAQSCWRDCTPCFYCECGVKVIPDKKIWDDWKSKFDKRTKIPAAVEHNDYFIYHRQHTKNFNENYFSIYNGEAVPIQTKINFK
jgi:hypothetical protein